MIATGTPLLHIKVSRSVQWNRISEEEIRDHNKVPVRSKLVSNKLDIGSAMTRDVC